MRFAAASLLGVLGCVSGAPRVERHQLPPQCFVLTFGPWYPAEAPGGLPREWYRDQAFLQLTDESALPYAAAWRVIVASEAGADTIWERTGETGHRYSVRASQYELRWRTPTPDSLSLHAYSIDVAGRWEADTLRARAHVHGDAWQPGQESWRASVLGVRYRCGASQGASAASAAARRWARRDTVDLALYHRETAAYNSAMSALLDSLQRARRP